MTRVSFTAPSHLSSVFLSGCCAGRNSCAALHLLRRDLAGGRHGERHRHHHRLHQQEDAGRNLTHLYSFLNLFHNQFNPSLFKKNYELENKEIFRNPIPSTIFAKVHFSYINIIKFQCPIRSWMQVQRISKFWIVYKDLWHLGKLFSRRLWNDINKDELGGDFWDQKNKIKCLESFCYYTT